VVHLTWTDAKEIHMLADIFGPDLLIVAIVLVVVLFGGAAIPKLARNLGSAKNEFEKGLGEAKKDSSAAASATGTVAASNGTAAAADTAAPSVTPKADDSAPGN
jgi:Sec-independent protein translocase protein TatA